MTAPGGKLASVTATASFPNLSRLGRAVASDSVVMCARLHAECASTPPSDARGDFPPGAYAPVPPVTSRKTRLRSDCSSSLNAWQFSMSLCARKTNTGEQHRTRHVLVAPPRADVLAVRPVPPRVVLRLDGPLPTHRVREILDAVPFVDRDGRGVVDCLDLRPLAFLRACDVLELA